MELVGRRGHDPALRIYEILDISNYDLFLKCAGGDSKGENGGKAEA